MSFRNKPRRKRSAIWTIDRTELETLVQQSNTIAEILRRLEIYTAGANRNSLLRRLKQDNISTDHIPTGIDSNKGRKFDGSKQTLSDDIVFVADSQTTRAVVRKKVIKRNLVPYACAECDQDNTWKGKSLSLVLDHINGIPNDHRLENLRFLCPNCNSQTDTFCGRNQKMNP